MSENAAPRCKQIAMAHETKLPGSFNLIGCERAAQLAGHSLAHIQGRAPDVAFLRARTVCSRSRYFACLPGRKCYGQSGESAQPQVGAPFEGCLRLKRELAQAP